MNGGVKIYLLQIFVLSEWKMRTGVLLSFFRVWNAGEREEGGTGVVCEKLNGGHCRLPYNIIRDCKELVAKPINQGRGFEKSSENSTTQRSVIWKYESTRDRIMEWILFLNADPMPSSIPSLSQMMPMLCKLVMW